MRRRKRAKPPKLGRPISKEQFSGEVHVFLEIVSDGLLAVGVRALPRVKVAFREEVDREHARAPRRYATFDFNTNILGFARAILEAPKPVRYGVAAHEAGHFAAFHLGHEQHSEGKADRLVEPIVRGKITYDRRWGGKGAQSLSRAGVDYIDSLLRRTG